MIATPPAAQSRKQKSATNRSVLLYLARTFRAAWASMFGHDVFVSYARMESRGLARRIEKELVRRGFTVFRDYSGLIGGDAYRVSLRNAAARCRLHVLILGQAALKSSWVQKEIRARFAWKRLKGGNRPFFPVFAKDLDWAAAPAFVRRTRASHGYPMEPAAGDPATWNARAIAAAVEASFKGRRSRTLWRMTGGVMLALLLSLGAVSFWLWLSSGWRQRSLEWQAVAESAEAGLRFSEAEIAWARGAEADGRQRGKLTPRYQTARAKRLLTLGWQVALPNADLLWLGQRGGQPLMAVKERGGSEIRLWNADGWSASVPAGEDSGHRFLPTELGLVVLSGDFIWLVPWQGSPQSVPASLRHGLTMGFSRTGHQTPDLRLKNGKVHLLGLAGGVPSLVEIDPAAWNETRRVLLKPLNTGSAMRIAETEKWVAIGAEVDADSTVPAANLFAWDSAGERTVIRKLARLPEEFLGGSALVNDVIPSLDDQQFFIEIEARRMFDEALELPRLQASSGGLWIGIDVDPRRAPAFIGNQARTLRPLFAWDDSEAIFADSDGELRLLTWEGPPTLARPLRTVLAGVKSWTVIDPGRGMRVPVMLAVFQGHRVHLVRGLQRILEVSEDGLDSATQSIRLHASADGSLLAAEVHPDNHPESARAY